MSGSVAVMLPLALVSPVVEPNPSWYSRRCQRFPSGQRRCDFPLLDFQEAKVSTGAAAIPNVTIV